MVAGAFQTRGHRAAGKAADVVVAEVEALLHGVALDNQRPVVHRQIDAGGVVADEEQVVGGDQPWHQLQAGLERCAPLNERRRIFEQRGRINSRDRAAGNGHRRRTAATAGRQYRRGPTGNQQRQKLASRHPLAAGQLPQTLALLTPRSEFHSAASDSEAETPLGVQPQDLVFANFAQIVSLGQCLHHAGKHTVGVRVVGGENHAIVTQAVQHSGNSPLLGITGDKALAWEILGGAQLQRGRRRGPRSPDVRRCAPASGAPIRSLTRGTPPAAQDGVPAPRRRSAPSSPSAARGDGSTHGGT